MGDQSNERDKLCKLFPTGKQVVTDSWDTTVREGTEHWLGARFLDQRHLDLNPISTTYYCMTLDKFLKSVFHLLMTRVDQPLMGLLGELHEIISIKP